MSEDHSKREHVHIQTTKAMFHSETLAPLKGGSGKPRFSVEPTIYIAGLGWDTVDPMNSGNEFIIGFYNYVRSKELMGYEHTGLTSEEIKQTYTNLWGKWIDET